MGIMLVDDEQHFIDEMKEILTGESPHRILANYLNGTDALSTIEDLNPDLLIVDVLMPGMSGLELARRAKSMKPDLPIILMSDDPSYGINAYDMGIAGFLLKPLEKDKVNEIINRLLCG